jgi:hypothetical protein
MLNVLVAHGCRQRNKVKDWIVRLLNYCQQLQTSSVRLSALEQKKVKRRVHFRNRRTGFSVYLTGTPWSEDFMRQYAAALEGVRERREIVGEKRTVAGTISALIVSYYASLIFRDLKASTQANRRGILERFRKDYGDLPVKGLTRAGIDKIMGAKANTPMAANNFLKVLRSLLDHAVAQNIIVVNPTIGVKRYRAKGTGIHTWTEEEIAQFQARHPVNTRAGILASPMAYGARARA